MSAGTALSVCLLVYAGLSLFIMNGPYIYMVVCVVYAYNLTLIATEKLKCQSSNIKNKTETIEFFTNRSTYLHLMCFISGKILYHAKD